MLLRSSRTFWLIKSASNKLVVFSLIEIVSSLFIFLSFCAVWCEINVRNWSISVFNSYIPTISKFTDLGYDPIIEVLISDDVKVEVVRISGIQSLLNDTEQNKK